MYYFIKVTGNTQIITPTTLWMNTVPEENWEETCYSEDTTTFAGLIRGWRLGAPPGGVPPPPSLEQKVDKRLRALQGAPLPQALPFLLLLLLLFNLYDYPTTNIGSFLLDYLLDFLIHSCRLTCYCDLALRPGDGSAGSAQRQENCCFGRLFPRSARLPSDRRVFEQSGWSEAASRVGCCPLGGKVRLDGGFGSLGLRSRTESENLTLLYSITKHKSRKVCRTFGPRWRCRHPPCLKETAGWVETWPEKGRSGSWLESQTTTMRWRSWSLNPGTKVSWSH